MDEILIILRKKTLDRVKERIIAASSKTFEQLKEEHIADYQSLYKREIGLRYN